MEIINCLIFENTHMDLYRTSVYFKYYNMPGIAVILC